MNQNYITTIMGEPKMDKRGFRKSIGAPKSLPKSTIDINIGNVSKGFDEFFSIYFGVFWVE